jgi:hypothetical protein
VVTGVVALLAACAGETGSSGALERDSAGVTIVENDPDRPIWTEETAWRLSVEPALSIGAASGDSAYLIHRAFHTRRFTNGTIAVANSGTTDARLYGPDGRHLRTLGRSGDGPGEFRSPWAVFELPGDSVAVVDLYRAVVVFGPDGGFARQFAVGAHDAGGGEVPEGQFADGSFLMMEYDRGDVVPAYGEWVRAELVRREVDGTGPHAIRYIDEQVTSQGGPRRMFGPRAAMAAADSTVWYSRGDAVALEETALNGAVLRMARLALPPRPVTEAHQSEYLDRLVEANPGLPVEAFTRGAEWPEVLPAHGAVLADAGGNVWIGEFPMGSQPRTWHVFRPDGHYLGAVGAPAGLIVHQIGHDFLLGVQRDELGVERVQLYDVIKPKEP